MAGWMSLAVIGVVVAITIFTYNRLVALVQYRKQAFANIDVQMKLRHDLIPNLVASVKGYAKHEKGTFEEVAKARARAMGASGSGKERAAAEVGLSMALMNMMMVTENYPELKADKGFQQLQNELSDIEEKLAATRRFFNGSTTEYNAYLKQFPTVFIGAFFGFSEEKFLEFEEAERKAMSVAPKISFS